MKWIRTAIGDRCHVVFDARNSAATVCGIPLTRVTRIVTPGPDDRCGRCDCLWREIGLKQRPLAQRRRDVYRPRFTFEDWENT